MWCKAMLWGFLVLGVVGSLVVFDGPREFLLAIFRVEKGEIPWLEGNNFLSTVGHVMFTSCKGDLCSVVMLAVTFYYGSFVADFMTQPLTNGFDAGRTQSLKVSARSLLRLLVCFFLNVSVIVQRDGLLSTASALLFGPEEILMTYGTKAFALLLLASLALIFKENVLQLNTAKTRVEMMLPTVNLVFFVISYLMQYVQLLLMTALVHLSLEVLLNVVEVLTILDVTGKYHHFRIMLFRVWQALKLMEVGAYGVVTGVTLFGDKALFQKMILSALTVGMCCAIVVTKDLLDNPAAGGGIGHIPAAAAAVGAPVVAAPAGIVPPPVAPAGVAAPPAMPPMGRGRGRGTARP